MKRIAVIIATVLALAGCNQRTTTTYKDAADLDVHIDDARGVVCYRTVFGGGSTVALSCVNVSAPVAR